VTVLAGPYGHPVHPILVSVPIGAWIASLVFDVGSHIVDKPGFLSHASQWLIAIGVLGALAAAVFGFLDLVTIPPGSPALRTALIHMTLNLVVTVAYVVNFLWRRSDAVADGPVGGGPLALSVVSIFVLGVSGFLGGKLAYHYGVRVADESSQHVGRARVRAS